MLVLLFHTSILDVKWNLSPIISRVTVRDCDRHRLGYRWPDLKANAEESSGNSERQLLRRKTKFNANPFLTKTK